MGVVAAMLLIGMEVFKIILSPGTDTLREKSVGMTPVTMRDFLCFLKCWIPKLIFTNSTTIGKIGLTQIGTDLQVVEQLLLVYQHPLQSTLK